MLFTIIESFGGYVKRRNDIENEKESLKSENKHGEPSKTALNKECEAFDRKAESLLVEGKVKEKFLNSGYSNIIII